MEQILLAYGLSKETVVAMMLFNKNTEVKVHSPDGDTYFFHIVTGVLQGDAFAPNQFITCQDYVRHTSLDLMK